MQLVNNTNIWTERIDSR